MVAVMDTLRHGGYIARLRRTIVARGNTITGRSASSSPSRKCRASRYLASRWRRSVGDLKPSRRPTSAVRRRRARIANVMVQDSFAWVTGLVRRASFDRAGRARRRPRLHRPSGTTVSLSCRGDEEKRWHGGGRENIGKGTEIVDWEAPFTARSLRSRLAVTDQVRGPWARRQRRRTKLDGLLVLWHLQLDPTGVRLKSRIKSESFK